MGPPRSISVWIGKIGTNVPDRVLRSALELIGGLLNWRRDGKGGVLKTFGFAEFSSPAGAVHAKAVLNDLPLGDSVLSVKIDEKTQKIIDAWSHDNPDEAKKCENSSSLKTSIHRVFEESGLSLGPPAGQNASSSLPNASSESSTLDSNGENRDSSASTSTGNVQPIAKLSAAQKKVLAYEQRREEERKRDLERKLELMEEDKERERKRLEKNEQLYKKLWREYDEEQRERKAMIAKRKKADEEASKLRSEDLEDENTLTWGTDEEKERREKELRKKYMSSEFVKMRKREAEFDAAAKAEEEAERRAELRKLEEQHKEKVRQQQEEQAARLKAERERIRNAEEHSTSTTQGSHNGNGALKKRSGGMAEPINREGASKVAKYEESHESPHSAIQSRSIGSQSAPSDTSVDEAIVNPSLSTSSSSLKLAALNAKIPSDLSTLFATPIRYDLLEQHNILETTLKPWITKKIFEYLEVEEETMIQFICTHISEHKPTRELIAQLQPVLDDDAQLFVITLTRLLLLESLKLEE